MKNRTHDEVVTDILFNHFLKEVRARAEEFSSGNDKKQKKQFIEELNKIGYNFEDFELLSVLNITDERMLPIVEKYLYNFDNLGISVRLLKLISIKGFKEAARLNIKFYEFLKKHGEKYKYLIDSIDQNLWRIKDKSYMEIYKKWFDNIEDHMNMDSTVGMYVRWNKRDPEIREKLIEYLQSGDRAKKNAALNDLPLFGDKTMVEYVKPLLENASQGEAKFYNEIIGKLNKLK